MARIKQAHAPAYVYENPVRARIAMNRAEKRAIAAKALDLIPNHQTIFIAGGTTNLALAKMLANQRTRRKDAEIRSRVVAASRS